MNSVSRKAVESKPRGMARYLAQREAAKARFAPLPSAATTETIGRREAVPLLGLNARLAPAAIPMPTTAAQEAIFCGQHWGGFWPEEFVPEVDAVHYEPTSEPGNAAAAGAFAEGQRESKGGPFEVCYSDGRIFKSYEDRWEAVIKLNSKNVEGGFVLQAGIVVARRETAAVRIGDCIATLTSLCTVAVTLDSERAA